MINKNAIVVGAGIVGLATARALALKGFNVTILEKESFANGASVRNFGMVWPIGQPAGKLYNRAINSRNIWASICINAGFWHNPCGSLHIATSALEVEVMQQIAAAYSNERPVKWLDKNEIEKYSSAVNTTNALGALWSAEEVIVESREIILQLPQYFQEKFNIKTLFNHTVTQVKQGMVIANNKVFNADIVCICSGADFEYLYADEYAKNGFTKCKLQMFRLNEQPNQFSIGASLCGGLSLIHYKSFEVANSLPALKQYFENNMLNYMKNGIHVMASQNQYFEITVGDTHHYGNTLKPFDGNDLNDLVLKYLKQFTKFNIYDIKQCWNGTYAKLTNGATEYVNEVENGVWIINGLGGAGMTLSFGLAEEWAAENV